AVPRAAVFMAAVAVAASMAAGPAAVGEVGPEAVAADGIVEGAINADIRHPAIGPALLRVGAGGLYRVGDGGIRRGDRRSKGLSFGRCGGGGADRRPSFRKPQRSDGDTRAGRRTAVGLG